MCIHFQEPVAFEVMKGIEDLQEPSCHLRFRFVYSCCHAYFALRQGRLRLATSAAAVNESCEQELLTAVVVFWLLIVSWDKTRWYCMVLYWYCEFHWASFSDLFRLSCWEKAFAAPKSQASADAAPFGTFRHFFTRFSFCWARECHSVTVSYLEFGRQTPWHRGLNRPESGLWNFMFI